MEAALDAKDQIVNACQEAGYLFCALDLEGLASGRLNRLVG
jgi:hypothetical protein